ncbi:MAG: hypothetical protein PHF18_08490 [Methanosarcina sp.]|uniref:hypothetical protein n=1 Tax=Methanosarcina sp. TaxID=2213 RepID=UPI002602B4D4|nr:hypothetical protein [Methanosarcina sp.]MDD3246874.1 hypothetical protein [Methanosarcina sp.]MDD4248286.1 hypothetical protein [Methanosarcina sp.]
MVDLREPLLNSLARMATQFYRNASKVTFGRVVADLISDRTDSDDSRLNLNCYLLIAVPYSNLKVSKLSGTIYAAEA